MTVPIVTIPTYWTRKGGVKKLTDSYFDHPTALDGEQTLTRTLDSFKSVEGDFKVVVISTVVDYKDAKLIRSVTKRVNSLVKKYAKYYPIMHFSKEDVSFLRKRMSKYSHSNGLASQINLTCYPAIRNFQLIIANALGSDSMIGIDDDELVMPEHIKKATEFIGKKYGGERIYGIGGFYRNKEGTYFMKDMPKPKQNNVFVRKNYVKNKGFIEIDKLKGRLHKSNFVFGGNMVIHRNMFMNVAYDLAISRGENMDYLINARMNGFDFYFDKEQYIIHMPPEDNSKKKEKWAKTGAFSAENFYKLQQDIMRFVYENQKIIECNEHHAELKKIDTKKLMPYPGSFFVKNLLEDAVEVLNTMFHKEIQKKEIMPKSFVRSTLERSRKLAPQYFIFNKQWKKLMKEISKDKTFSNYLNKKWVKN